ncbi:hypothetical protein GOP56_07145 [Brevibacillus sp. 7WMA2]|uniref:hypothetical protein n=1 Tax=Brevibacillus sp. 7WMA2 TaxID=2683193 RepID=UPI0013A76C2E|nr:hypothetical protein [Brevibacillus sp. 7WMA2]QIC04117.1 hypothetical protein GOP56_07145 [Brevibacillus sp. 7WMA2]WPS90222.1 hypothetical protein SMD22_17020 [Brevibacillus halotolerans]
MILMKPMDLADMEQEREKGKISPELIEAYEAIAQLQEMVTRMEAKIKTLEGEK